MGTTSLKNNLEWQSRENYNVQIFICNKFCLIFNFLNLQDLKQTII